MQRAHNTQNNARIKWATNIKSWGKHTKGEPSMPGRAPSVTEEEAARRPGLSFSCWLPWGGGAGWIP